MNFYPVKIIFFTLIVFLSLRYNGYGQSSGLHFSSHEVVQDKRTSLDLSPGKSLCFNDDFELSFELSFVPNLETYFGYIVRIIKDDKQNIDIVYDAQLNKNRFNLIIGEKLSHITFDIDQSKLFNQWNKLHIKFDFKNDKITLFSGNKSYVESGLGLTKNGCYKILFGANRYSKFETTDIPPMEIRNVALSQNGATKYSWPLDERKGLIVHEVLAQNDGAVINPVWVAALHHDWHLVKNITVKGPASIAFNQEKETLYVVGADSLYSYSVTSSKWNNKIYPAGDIVLNIGNESGYNPFDKKLYNILPEQEVIPAYNFDTFTWDKAFKTSPLTNYWQFSKMFSSSDTSLYLFGGYGHLHYKNDVQQFKFSSHTWQKINPKGDFFMPRYLAALGSTAKGDTAYILGGYGNSSGQQILNPKNIYDLMRYTVKDNRFKKLFELNVYDDFVFANSLIINEKAKTYYGLIFPQHKYDSNLQLVEGSLTKPSYTRIGSLIPYSFHDIHSFADLYYCPVSKKFIAVTLLRSQDSKTTTVNIYSLLCPPLGYSDSGILAKQVSRLYLWIIGFVVIVGGVVLYFYRRRKKEQIARAAEALATHPELPATEQIPPHFIEYHIAENKVPEKPVVIKNSVFLFGDLQIFDAEGSDITKFFTPLIKELFLVILLYSIRWGRGLSSEKLNEILWYDKSAKSARNNRSVNITKLKTLLDKLNNCHLSKDTGYWKIDIDYQSIYVDYHSYLEIIKDKKQPSIQAVKALTDIVNRGNFLSNIEYEWLDPFKSQISNDVIDNFLHFVHSGNYSQDPELLIEIANFIFYFDPVNEEAMTIKCRALSTLGKHSLARQTFENFSKEYRGIYGEEFKKDFHAISE